MYSFVTNKKIVTEKIYINGNFYYYLSKNGECMYSSPPCTNYNIDKKLSASNLAVYKVLKF